MRQKKAVKIILLVAAFGVAFSGYLTFGTLLVGSCPLSGECPYFLGYPACDYGLIMFLIIFFSSLALFKTKYNPAILLKVILFVSIIGIIFSGYFSITELLNPRQWVLLLPSCVYGLAMYVIIAGIALKVRSLKTI